MMKRLIAACLCLALAHMAPPLAAAESTASPAAAISQLVLQADTAIEQTRYKDAADLLAQAYQLLGTAADDALARQVLNSLATLHYSSADLELAEKYYLELIELDSRSDDQLSLSVSAFNMGHVAASRQQFERADDYFHQALELSLTLDDQAGVAHALKALAVNAQAQGDLAGARANLETALQKFRELGDEAQGAVVLRNLAEVELSSGNPDTAVSHYETALPILMEHNNTATAIPALRGLSRAYEQTGDYRRALATHQLYAELMKAELEQQSMESTQRIREQLGLRRFAQANADLENIRLQQAMQLQASERLVSLQYAMLLMGLGFMLLLAYMYRRSQQTARQMHRLATTDELTQLLNRRAIMEKGRQEHDRALRHGRPLSCLLFDVDHFKSINDTYGHLTGDRVLKEICRELHQILRHGDQVGRIGGEEFFLVAAETCAIRAAQLAERIRAGIAAMKVDGIDDRVISVSIGIAHLQEGSSVEQMLQHADKALYQAKGAGRNCCITYQEPTPVQTPAA